VKKKNRSKYFLYTAYHYKFRKTRHGRNTQEEGKRVEEHAYEIEEKRKEKRSLTKFISA
jgi:uncharacterized protein (DUF2384 family)